jgi:hypothetical protein
MAGRVAGTGQVGAGLVQPPRECFEQALAALAEAPRRGLTALTIRLVCRSGRRPAGCDLYAARSGTSSRTTTSTGG